MFLIMFSNAIVPPKYKKSRDIKSQPLNVIINIKTLIFNLDCPTFFRAILFQQFLILNKFTTSFNQILTRITILDHLI